MFSAFSMLIELGMKEQYEIKGPPNSREVQGVFIHMEERKQEINNVRTLVYELFISCAIIFVLIAISSNQPRHKSELEKLDILDSENIRSSPSRDFK